MNIDYELESRIHEHFMCTSNIIDMEIPDEFFESINLYEITDKNYLPF
jgi:hypothetical protein